MTDATIRASGFLLEQRPWVNEWFPVLDGDVRSGATVWHVFHQMKCTLHVIPCAPTAHRRARKIFRRLHQIRMPALVPVHDLIVRSDSLAVLEGCHGGYSLRDSLNEMGALSIQEALTVFRQIIHAVACLHDNGLVHGDLRPENVLLDVTDAGLQVRIRRVAHGMLGLKPMDACYQSPEGIRGAECNFRGDVFSLGVMFYECLAGDRPFGETDPFPLWQEISSREPQPLQTMVPGLPLEVAFAVSSALMRDPRRRFVNAAALGRAFDSHPPEPLEPIPHTVPSETILEAETMEVIDVPGVSEEIDRLDPAVLDPDAHRDITEEYIPPSPSEAPSVPEEQTQVPVQTPRQLPRELLVFLGAGSVGLLVMLVLMFVVPMSPNASNPQVSPFVEQGELLGEELVALGGDPDALRPLLAHCRSASSTVEQQRATALLVAEQLNMVRSLPNSEDMDVLQRRRHLELQLTALQRQLTTP